MCSPIERKRITGLLFILISFGLGMSHAQIVPLDEALDLDGQGYVFTVNQTPDSQPSWFGQTLVSSDGVDAAEVVVPSEQNIVHEMSTTVIGPIKVQFLAEYKTDPDPGDAYFEFLVDGQSRFQQLGNTLGVYESFLQGVESGAHEITWRYVKNFSFVNPQYVRVDQVQFLALGEGPPAFTRQPESLVDQYEGTSLTLSVDVIDADNYQWFKDGNLIPGATQSNLVFASLNSTNTGLYRVDAVNTAGTSSSFPSDVKVWTQSEVPDVLDNAGLGAVTFAGDGTWTPTRERDRRNDSSMRAPVLTHGQSADVCIDVTGPAKIDFSWLTDCERYDDVLELLVDGTPVKEKTGRALSSFFSSGSVTLSPGAHQVCWRFRKDAENNHYMDTAWLDYIRISTPGAGADAPSIERQPFNTEVEPGNAFELSVQLPSDIAQPVTVTWLKDNTPIPGANGTSLSITNATASLHDGEYVTRVVNANGSIDSDPAIVRVRDDYRSNLVEVWRPPTSKNLESILTLQNGDVLVFGEGVMLRSTDGGQSYSATNPFYGRRINAAAIADNGVLMVVGNSGFTALSTDLGFNWAWDSSQSPVHLNDVSWVSSTAPNHPNGFFCAVGDEARVIRLALDAIQARPARNARRLAFPGDYIWEKIHHPDNQGTDWTACDSAGDQLVLTGGNPALISTCDVSAGSCSESSPLEIQGAPLDFCSLVNGGNIECYVLSSQQWLSCDETGTGPPAFDLPTPGCAIACSADDVFIAVEGSVQHITGGSMTSMPLPDDTCTSDLDLDAGGTLTGCGDAGFTYICTGGACDLTSSPNARAIAAGGGAVVAEGGTAFYLGQPVTFSGGTPAYSFADISFVGDAVVFQPEDLSNPAYVLGLSGVDNASIYNGTKNFTTAFPMSSGQNVGMPIDILIHLQNPYNTPIGAESWGEMFITSEGDVYCSLQGDGATQVDPGEIPLADGERFIDIKVVPITIDHTVSGEEDLEVIGVLGFLVASDGTTYMLDTLSGSKIWVENSPPCPDLDPDEIVEVVFDPDGNVLALTRFGEVLGALQGGAWMEIEDLDVSGFTYIYYEDGFRVYNGLAVYKINDDLSGFTRQLTRDPAPPDLTTRFGGADPVRVTSTGGVEEPEPMLVTVPNLVFEGENSLTREEAERVLREHKLVPGNNTRKVPSVLPMNHVLSQSPVTGEAVPAGSAVDMTLSTAPLGQGIKLYVGGRLLDDGKIANHSISAGDGVAWLSVVTERLGSLRACLDGELIPIRSVTAKVTGFHFSFEMNANNELPLGLRDIKIEQLDAGGNVINRMDAQVFVQEQSTPIGLGGFYIGRLLGNNDEHLRKPVPEPPSPENDVHAPGNDLPRPVRARPAAEGLLFHMNSDLPIDAVTVSIDGQPPVTVAPQAISNLNSWWGDLGNLSAGPHDVLIQGFDSASNLITRSQHTITVQAIASTVHIGGTIIPSGMNGEFSVHYEGLMPVAIDYSEAVADVQIRLNNRQSVPAHVVGNDGLSWYVNLNGLSLGNHAIEIEAFDAATNRVSHFKSVVFVQDLGTRVRMNGQSVASGAGGNKQVQYADPLQVEVRYDRPVTDARLGLDDGGLRLGFPGTPLTPGDLTRWTFDIPAVQEGYHEIFINGLDVHGRPISRYASPIRLQRLVGEVTINGRPLASGTVGNKGIPFGDPLDVRVGYTGAVATVRLRLDGERPATLSPVGGDFSQWTTNLTGLVAETYNITIDAFDAVGKQVSVFECPVVIQAAGFDLPEITLNTKALDSGSSGLKGSTTTAVLNVTAHFPQEVDHMRMRLDGLPAVERAPNGVTFDDFTLPVFDLSQGYHSVEVEGFDASGNKVSAFQSIFYLFPAFSISRNAQGFQLLWEGEEILQHQIDDTGDWLDLPEASSPFERVPGATQDMELFRLRAP